MSKSPEKSKVSYGTGYAVTEGFIPTLEGQLLTLVESFGLKETQEKAAKDLVRQTIWKAVYGYAVVIGERTNTAIREARFKGSPKEPPGAVEIV